MTDFPQRIANAGVFAGPAPTMGELWAAFEVFDVLPSWASSNDFNPITPGDGAFTVSELSTWADSWDIDTDTGVATYSGEGTVRVSITHTLTMLAATTTNGATAGIRVVKNLSDDPSPSFHEVGSTSISRPDSDFSNVIISDVFDVENGDTLQLTAYAFPKWNVTEWQIHLRQVPVPEATT